MNFLNNLIECCEFDDISKYTKDQFDNFLNSYFLCDKIITQKIRIIRIIKLLITSEGKGLS